MCVKYQCRHIYVNIGEQTFFITNVLTLIIIFFLFFFFALVVILHLLILKFLQNKTS